MILLMHSQKRKQQGITYVEVMVATVLIAILLVPAMEGLQPGIKGSAIHKENTEVYYALSGKMESLLVKSFNELDLSASNAGSATTPSAYSVSSGSGIHHDVFIWRYDVDNADADNNVFTGGEADLLWIKVSLPDNSQSFETLLHRY